MLLSVLYFLAIKGAVAENTELLRKLFLEKKVDDIDEAQREVKRIGEQFGQIYNSSVHSLF